MCRDPFLGTREALNNLHVKFYCGGGNEVERFSEFLGLMMDYLSMKIGGSGDVETSIRNRKVFEPEQQNPVGPNTKATKAMLQAEYATRAKRV